MKLGWLIAALVLAGSAQGAEHQTTAAPHFVCAMTAGHSIALIDSEERVSFVQPDGRTEFESASLSADGTRRVFTSFDSKTTYEALYVSLTPFKNGERIGARVGWHRAGQISLDGKSAIFALNINSHWFDQLAQRDYAQLFEEDLATRTRSSTPWATR